MGRRPGNAGSIRRRLAALVAAAMLALVAALGAGAAQAAEVVAGGWRFDVQSVPLPKDGYQIAYSQTNNLVWASATSHHWNLGYPMAQASSVTAFNPDTLQALRTITPNTLDQGQPTQRPEAAYGIAVDDVHNRVWTTASREGTVVVYDQATGAKVATIPGIPHGRDIAIDPYRNAAYVSDPGQGIYKIDTNTLQVDPGGPIPGIAPMSLDLVADQTKALLYTVDLDNGNLYEIDTVNINMRTVAQTGGQRASGVAVDPGRGLAYVSSQDSKDLRTIRLSDGALINTAASENALLNTAVDPVRGIVYSAEFGGDRILLADATTGARIGEIQVGAAPNDVVVANGAVWAVDRSTGADGNARFWKILPLGRTDAPDTPIGGGPGGGATATVEGTPRLGGTITLRGSGWQTQDGTQGSVIAIKLDDGRIAKPTGDVWQVIEAGADGTFTATVKLPDGTTDATNGSTPAYSTGAHWLRLLTGSLRSGDRVRTQRIDINVQAAAGAPTNTARPAIAGTVAFGSKLTARNGTWNGADGATFKYQWLRAGKPIAKATRRTYTVTAKDIRKKLSVRVTATSPAGAASATSAAKTAAKAKAKVTVIAGKRVGGGRVPVTVKVAIGTRRPATGRVRVLVGGTTAATVTLRARSKGIVRVLVPARSTTVVSAVYLGNATWAKVTGKKTLRVGAAGRVAAK
ncbi:MAG: hypothetical protein AB7V42_06465 [Thermoleophilia bacterium]